MRKFLGYEKGINLGGWLSQCVHTTEHYDSFITEQDFAEASKWGIDHVRIPVDYDLLEDENGVSTTYGMDYLNKAVEWCAKYNLNMVLDVHKTAGYSFDSGENESGFFSSPALQERFYKLWDRFAEAYGKYSDRIVFELLNEITDKADCEKWNEIAEECIRRIRVNAPDTYILVGGYWNNSVDALPDLAMPYDDKIVYNFHCYEPLLFTHQGAYWVEGMPQDFRIKYEEMEETGAAMQEQLGIHSAFDAAQAITAETFIEHFSKAVQIAEERNVPLYCGEYGVIDLADLESTVAWYKDINTAFKKFGIGRAAWSWKKMDFGLSDERLAPVANEIKKYL